MTWKVTYRINRYKPGEPQRTDTFEVDIEPQRTVLDGIEMIWAKQDRTLTFRHACHHASCGSCAIVANGVEVLPCIVEIQDVIGNGGTLYVEPLHVFPVVSDLVVDMGPMFDKLQQVRMPIIGPTDPLAGQPSDHYHAFENCIECGMCVSACPVAQTSPKYLGPAVLAQANREIKRSDITEADKARIWDLVDSDDGIWRCHVALECTAICPSNVDPGGKIMELRRMATMRRIRRLLGLKPRVSE
jgi:succinate dehydrogenase / fumarate reductase iron-sulfur subunit